MSGRTRQQIVVPLVVGVVVVACWITNKPNQPESVATLLPNGKAALGSSSLETSNPGSVLGLERTRTGPMAGISIPGKAHQIRSPFAPKGPIIDVEGLPPGTQIECPSTGKALRVPGDPRLVKVKEKLESLVFPELDLKDQSLAEAIDFLQAESVKLDPEGKGVKIRVREGESPNADSRIHLNLQNVPLAEALRYVGGLVNLRYNTTADGVEFHTEPSQEELFTRRYQAPPLFAEEKVADPFLNGGVATKRAKNAKEILTDLGIEFGEGATAFYVRGPLIVRTSGELVVRATQEQLEVVDQLVADLNDGGVPQQLGFDWVVP